MHARIERSRVLSVLLVSLLSAVPGWAESSSDQPSIGVPQLTKGKAFNPDISANFLGLFQRGTGLPSDRAKGPPYNGPSLQEAEVQFTADVDPYLRGVALLSVAQDGPEYGIDPEEVFAETLSLPGVTLRAGKFKLALGKHNQLHTHAFPFIDAPLIHQALLGDEGLNEVGLSVAVLLPTGWYSELVVQGFSLSNEDLYASPNSGDIGGLARLKNLWDFSEDLTMELGLSGTAGKNAFDRTASAYGADLTFKWRPAEGGKYTALILAGEYLAGNRPGAPIERLGGMATWLQYQFAQRWWVQARYEHVGMPHPDAIPTQDKQSALIGFFPSEFSGLRLQYDHLTTKGEEKAQHTVAFQYNISIGAHPAHAY